MYTKRALCELAEKRHDDYDGHDDGDDGKDTTAKTTTTMCHFPSCAHNFIGELKFVCKRAKPALSGIN